MIGIQSYHFPMMYCVSIFSHLRQIGHQVVYGRYWRLLAVGGGVQDGGKLLDLNRDMALAGVCRPGIPIFWGESA